MINQEVHNEYFGKGIITKVKKGSNIHMGFCEKLIEVYYPKDNKLITYPYPLAFLDRTLTIDNEEILLDIEKNEVSFNYHLQGYSIEKFNKVILSRMIKTKKLDYLIHYTHINNLVSIDKQNYIMPKSLLINKGIKVFGRKMDIMDDYVHMSFNYPNFMEMINTNIGINDLAIICIDPKLLIDTDSNLITYYYKDSKDKTLPGFMGAVGLKYVYGGRDTYCYDYSAEILFDGVIPSKYIKAVCLNNEIVLENIKSKVSDNLYGILEINSDIFEENEGKEIWNYLF